MNTTDKKILRDECIAEIERELKMRVVVWAQTRPIDPVTGPTFRDPKHQKQFARMDAVLTVIKAMTPEQFFDFWQCPPHIEPESQQKLF